MSDRIVGHPPIIAVSGNVITWPKNEFDGLLFSDAANDHVIKTNGTPSTSAIVSNDGLVGDTYKITVTPGHGIVTGDRCSPQIGNTTNTYTTVAAAFSAAVVLDRLLMWYQNTDKNSIWLENINAGTAKAVTVLGMLRRRRIRMQPKPGNFFVMTGDLTAASSQVTIENLSIFGSTGVWGILYNGTSGAGMKVKRCYIQGFQNGIGCAISGTHNFENNLIVGVRDIGLLAQIVTATIVNNTVIAAGNQGFNGTVLAYTLRNNLMMWNGTDYFGTGSAVKSNNWSSDATGDETNKVDSDIGWMFDNANDFYPQDYRVKTSAGVLAQGTATDAPTLDIDGQTRPGPPSVGCSEGISFSTAADFPERENVRDNDTVDGLIGLYERALQPDVRLATTYGANGTQFTGELIPGGTVPGNPTLNSAIVGDGQITLAFSAADPADVIFARFRLVGSGHTGAWEPESGLFSRVGSGDIVITGLVNQKQYEFSGYAKDGTLTSDWVSPLLATPTDGTIAAAAIVAIADEIVTELNGGSFSTSFTALRLFIPDFDRSNDLDTLKVSVVPRDIQMEIISRNKTKQTVKIDVAIQKSVDNSFSQVDPLLSLVDEIDLFMRFVTLAGGTEASWINTSPNPYYSISHREELFVFTSVLQFTFVFFR